MTENVNTLSLYNSVLEDNDKLRKENAALKSQLQEVKAAHTLTKCRSIFATHILNGNRDDKVEEFKIEHRIK